ncbi:hypothetical protein BH18THE1_BH18THE1_11740 [soil metagenome]
MYARFLVLMIISTLLVAVIYSSISSDLYALKVRSVKLCEKSTSDGITTETCCSLETDSSTEKTTQYCTECKTASKGEDLGCTHSQTDVGLTINGGVLGIEPTGPKVSTEESSNTKIPKDFNLKKGDLLTKDSQITTNEEDSRTPPPCPLQGPIPPDCTMKPPIEENNK